MFRANELDEIASGDGGPRDDTRLWSNHQSSEGRCVRRRTRLVPARSGLQVEVGALRWNLELSWDLCTQLYGRRSVCNWLRLRDSMRDGPQADS